MEPLNLLLFLFAQLKRHNIMVISNSWLQMDTESGVVVDIHYVNVLYLDSINFYPIIVMSKSLNV